LQALVKLLQLIRQDLDRERRGKQGVENLARALQQTPTFGTEDSQQNVTEKLHHVSLHVIITTDNMNSDVTVKSFISADAFPTEDVSHFYFIIVTYVSGYFTLCVGRCDRQDAF